MLRLAAAAAVSCAFTPTADAGMLVSWSLVEGNFQGVVSGSFSAAELAEATGFATTQSATAYIDTTPGFQIYPSGTHQRYNFPAAAVTFTPNFIRFNSYSGNTRSGDAFGFFQVGNNSLNVTVPSGYQADSPISGTFTSFAYGNSLSSAFTMGEVVKLNGNALITFSAAPVPEPSTWALAIAGLACGGWMMRRTARSRVSQAQSARPSQ